MGAPIEKVPIENKPPSRLDKQLPSSFRGNRDFYEESRWRKVLRKLKEEPLIPIGCAATTWALWNASRSVRKGDSANAQKMFRMRLYAQFFTVTAMCAGGIYYNRDRILSKEYKEIQEKKKLQEKNNLWIKELEARDLEEKEWRKKTEKVRERMKAETEERRQKLEKKRVEGGRVTRAVNALREKLTKPNDPPDT
ncbi:MAG: hypothetical protein LQ352_006843 [Teloschistes flavicans]|nr:MAG: hypothetical protein LQ352_006843 [Teloschistes flavicans]